MDIWESSAFDECLEKLSLCMDFFSPSTFCLDKYMEELRDYKGVENLGSHNKVVNVQ